MKLSGSIVFAWLVLASFVGVSASPLEHWNWLSPLPSGLPLRVLHFDGQAFFAAGARLPWEVWQTNYISPKADAVIRSVDGSNWVVVQTITNGPVVRIESDAGEVLAYTQSEAWRSSDGVHWAVQPFRLPAMNGRDYYRIGRASGQFVAVRQPHEMGNDGVLHYGQFVSVDGVNWRLTGAPANDAPETSVAGLAYGNGRWVEILSNGKVFVSTDGESWSTGTAVSPDVFKPSVAFLQFEGGEFIAAIAAGRLARSSDGLNWSDWFVGGFRALESVARGPDAWVISADGGRAALRTADFLNAEWYEIQSQGFSPMYSGSACRYGNGRYVAVSDGSVSINHHRSGQIHSSPDGRTWTRHNPIVTNSTTYGSAQGNGRIIAVGNNAIDGHGNVGISEDGTHWRFVDVDVPYPLYGITFGAGRFVTLGRPQMNTANPNVALLSSTDGINWQKHYEFTNSGGALIYGNGQFLMATRSNLLVSKDGIEWEQRPRPAELTTAGFIFGGDQFTSGIVDGQISRSRDGLNWTLQQVPAAQGRTFFPGTYGQGLFVQCSAYGAVMTSPDAEHWEVMENALPGYGFGMTYGRGWFVAATFKLHDSALYASQDGLHWTRVLESVGEVIQHIRFYQDHFLAFGDGSTVLASDPLPALRELSIHWVGGTSRRFQVTGTPNLRYDLEVSTGLSPTMTWQRKKDLNLPESGVIEFDLAPPSEGAEFYRVGR